MIEVNDANEEEGEVDAKKRMRCDIVVVGGGNAALVAAIETRNRAIH
jgi:ribulose 1,5-bisphosphate synthetase/thiazole synthase